MCGLPSAGRPYCNVAYVADKDKHHDKGNRHHEKVSSVIRVSAMKHYEKRKTLDKNKYKHGGKMQYRNSTEQGPEWVTHT